MRCVANCRELLVIDGSWAVKELKRKPPKSKKNVLAVTKNSLYMSCESTALCVRTCLTAVREVKGKAI